MTLAEGTEAESKESTPNGEVAGDLLSDQEEESLESTDIGGGGSGSDGGEGQKEKQSFGDFLKELPILIVVAFAIALFIKTFMVQAFYIPSGSMEDTLLRGDRVLVEKISYRFGNPKPGQVIVFVGPDAPPAIDRGPVGNFFRSVAVALGLASSEQDFIKRVVATGGQTIEFRDGSVFVDGKAKNEPYLRDDSEITCSGEYCGPFEIPEGELFVMGDNRSNSRDSRVFGPIQESTVVGKGWVLLWPPDRFAGL